MATNNRLSYERNYNWLFAANVLVAGLLLLVLLWGGLRLALRLKRGRFGSKLLLKLAGIFTLVGLLPGLLIYVVSYQFVSARSRAGSMSRSRGADRWRQSGQCHTGYGGQRYGQQHSHGRIAAEPGLRCRGGADAGAHSRSDRCLRCGALECLWQGHCQCGQIAVQPGTRAPERADDAQPARAGRPACRLQYRGPG